MLLRTKQDFQNSFKEFCVNAASRQITKNSLQKWCHKNKVKLDHVDSFMVKHDLNHDHVIEYSEFVQFYVSTEIKENFARYDVNNDQLITKQELRDGLLKSGHEEDMLDFEMNRILEKMDVNHDGKISYEEFANYYVRTNYSFDNPK